MLKESFTHNLMIPVRIASAGKEVEAVSIEVFAPTNQVLMDVTVIDFEFNKAKKNSIKDSSSSLKDLTPEQIESFRKIAENQKPVELDPLEVVREMTMNGADLGRCFLALKNILTSGNKERPSCLIDVEKMQAPIFDSLGVQDTKAILGKYVISFLDTSQNT